MSKAFSWFSLRFFEVGSLFITPSDARLGRNSDRWNKFLDKIIEDKKKTSTDGNDLFSILLTSEVFKDKEDIKAELFVFFLAGMKTIQISSTNLIYYM